MSKELQDLRAAIAQVEAASLFEKAAKGQLAMKALLAWCETVEGETHEPIHQKPPTAAASRKDTCCCPCQSEKSAG